MGIDKLTAYIIATRDDIIVTHGGPAKSNGKYAGWITLGEEDRYRSLLNTEAIYDTEEAADKAMENIVREIKISVEKETDGEHPINYVMGKGQETELIKDIIMASK